MALFDEEEVRREKEKNTKIKKMITIGIITTIVLIVALIAIISYLIYNPNKVTVYLDGKQSTKLENLLKVEKTDNGTKLYFPIMDLADYFEYKSNNGGYVSDLEDRDKCYVDTKEEVVIFTFDSNVIYKTQSGNINSEFETVEIDSPIKKENNKLYIDAYGLRKAFNMSIPTMNEKAKKLNITTLSSLVDTASSIAKKSGYSEIDTTFANKKAILDNMIIVIDNDKKMGVIDGTGKVIMGIQYDKITYVPQKQVFLVTKDSKIGIVDSNGETKISPACEELTLLDNENELYLAKYNQRYGVIDINGIRKIYFDYDKIGVDVSEFTANGVKSGYVLLGKLIPVLQNGKWRFFKIEVTTNEDGTKNVQCNDLNTQFDSIGCVSKTTRSTTSNVMIIPEYKVIVVERNGKYGLMDIDGKPAILPAYSDIYMETTSEKTQYYMIGSEDKKTYNVIEELEKRGYNKAIDVTK